MTDCERCNHSGTRTENRIKKGEMMLIINAKGTVEYKDKLDEVREIILACGKDKFGFYKVYIVLDKKQKKILKELSE